MAAGLKAAWEFRQFILSSIRHELIARFARSRLGSLWMVIQPLSQVLIYALILSAVLSAKLPGLEGPFAYAIYLTAGMLGWSLFMEVVTRSLGVFIDNGNLIKKMAFPRLVLPLIVVGSSLINNVVLFVAAMGVFTVLGHIASATVLWVPLLTVITLAFALGVGLILGILNVFLRDIGQIMPILLQFLFWFTPVVYPAHIVPDAVHAVLVLNPLYHLVTAYQNVLAFGEPPALTGLAVVAAIAAGLLVLVRILYQRAKPELVDAL